MPTRHPDISDLTVSQARAYLEKRPRKLEDFLAKLESDPRTGMQTLASRVRRERKAERSERARLQRLLKHEKRLWEKGFSHVAGVDEVGRGPLAGPVVAAAVILPQDARISGLDDSKVLKHEEREALDNEIREKAIAISLASVPAQEIDRINIYQATLRAMREAIHSLSVRPDYVLIDGNRVPKSDCRELAIIGGDAQSKSIAAASIVAKVARDREMTEWDKEYPEYGFASHKGYASERHTSALMQTGPCPLHRRSFSTVEDALAAWSDLFQEVRTAVDQFKRIAELDVYRKEVARKCANLPPQESDEIDRRIQRRYNHLNSPGVAGEEAAETWLIQNGYLILERNLKRGRGEIDLIAQQGNTLAFVEVKASSDPSVDLAGRVTPQKQSRLASAASDYLASSKTGLSPRFDVITVRLLDGGPAIDHYPNAFDTRVASPTNDV